MGSQTYVNGNSPTFKTIDHVTSYPVVNDSIEAVKSHPYGKKSLEVANDAYQRFGKPVEGYLQTPYSYAKPYVAKADELAASGLQQVDSRFPIVKEDSQTIIETAKSWVFWPLNYITSTYDDEYRKTAKQSQNENVLTLVKAIISTQLKIASDFFQAIADFLGPKYQESKKKGSDYVRQAQDTAEHYKQVGQDKLQDYQTIGQDKLNDYAKLGQEKADQAKSSAQQTADQTGSQVKQRGEQAKGAAQQTKEDAKAKAGSK